MKLNELFDLQEKLETRVNAYWTYWSVAIFAIGGWIFSNNGDLNGFKHMVAAGALVFFICNLGVLLPATRMAIGLRDEIRIKAQQANIESERLRAILIKDNYQLRLKLTVILHLVVDIAVIILICKTKTQVDTHSFWCFFA